jgi:hypothetical protein
MDGKFHELYETDFYAWTQQQAALLHWCPTEGYGSSGE